MANLPRLKAAVLLLLATAVLFFLLLAWQASASEIHAVYLPVISDGERQTGGPHWLPHATITPTPEGSP